MTAARFAAIALVVVGLTLDAVNQIVVDQVAVLLAAIALALIDVAISVQRTTHDPRLVRQALKRVERDAGRTTS